MRAVVLLLTSALSLATAPLRAAELPIFDAHVHYSHDAWEQLPPKEAAAILRRAGLKRALVSSSGDEGTQRLLAEAPELVLPSQASRYNLLGPFNDDTTRASATSTRHVALEHRNFGEFKVPTLRSLARTAPYMHDGSLPTLREVLRRYSDLNEERLHADGESILVPLRLTADETDDLLAFLDSLNEADPPR